MDSAETVKYQSFRNFFGLLLIPLGLEQWTAVPISGKAMPELRGVNQTWTLKTRGSAGGYVHFLEKPITLESGYVSISWEWMVRKFPRTRPVLPFVKSEDDYAIRIGALISDGEKQIPVHGDFKKILEERKQTVAFVLFYCAVPIEQMKFFEKSSCGSSPYHDHVANCVLPAGEPWSKNAVSPFKDAMGSFQVSDSQRKKLTLIGFWIFADSDNSNSDSEAELKPISVISRP
jgi:hypothetical protein